MSDPEESQPAQADLNCIEKYEKAPGHADFAAENLAQIMLCAR